MTTLTFRAPCDPWSTNDDRRLNKYARAEKVKVWKEATIVAAKDARLTPATEKQIITLVIPFTTQRKRDPHNWCGTCLKAVIDGLVKAGLTPDDTPDWIGHREPVLVVRKDRLVTVHIDPDDQGVPF